MKLGSIALRLIAVVGIMGLVIIPATPVFADTALPDNTPTVEAFNAYRNLLETGDMLIIIYANIPYASLPDDPVTQTFIWRLIDTDNVTQIGDPTVGYAYNDDGYGYNVFSLYFSAADAPTWGLAYPVRLSGNPSKFDDPPEYNYQIGSSDYSVLTASADVKAELANRILNLATDLNTKWGLLTDYFLTVETEAGTRLSAYGEAFFRGAIYGLQGLAPRAFSYVIEDIEVTARTWTEEYSGNLTDQWSGNWTGTAKAAGTALFGTGYDLLSIIMVLFMCFGVVLSNIILKGSAWAGMVDASVIAILTARLGMYPLGFLGLIAALCVIYGAMKLWGINR